MSAKTLGEQFPLHWLVWDNNFSELDKELAKDIVSKILISNDFRILIESD